MLESSARRHSEFRSHAQTFPRRYTHHIVGRASSTNSIGRGSSSTYAASYSGSQTSFAQTLPRVAAFFDEEDGESPMKQTFRNGILGEHYEVCSDHDEPL